MMKEFLDDMVESQVEMVAVFLESQHFFNVPASSKAILALPTTRVGETAEQGCTVCRWAFEEGDTLRVMSCSHSFHQSYLLAA